MSQTHLRHGRPHRIHGWGLIKARGARLPQRRYMRLIHYTLTVFDAADEEADLVIFEEVLVGTIVSAVKRRREIIIKFPGDRFVVQLRTDKQYSAWLQAFRDASRVASHFYKIVTTRELGRGAFSTVYFGFDRDDGHHVAVKVVDKTSCTRAELQYAETEARMMAYVRHPSIVLSRDIFDAPDAMHVVMEYMSGDTLEQRMLNRPPDQRRFDEQVTATIMSHVLSALAYLEAERVCHRDVKPENILLSTTSKDALWATTARLSDFGLAAFIESDNDLSDIVGTPHYVAPEVILRDATDNERRGYGPPVDVWAAGILMFWMLTGGALPFDGDDSAAVFRQIREAKLDLSVSPWTEISDTAKNLLQSLLHPDPNTRLRASGAVLHPFLLRAQADAGWPASTAVRFFGARPIAPQNRLRAAVRAVRVLVALGMLDIGDDGIRRRRSQRSNRARGPCLPRPAARGHNSTAMMRAPERAPVGADALGYNVGLIPSFAPKRRARAGGSAAPTAGTIGAAVAAAAAAGETGVGGRASSSSAGSDSGFTVRGSARVANGSGGGGSSSGRAGKRPSGGGGGGFMSSSRRSVESVVSRASSGGSRTPSVDRGVSLDRKSVGSRASTKGSAWSLVARVRGSSNESAAELS